MALEEVDYIQEVAEGHALLIVIPMQVSVYLKVYRYLPVSQAVPTTTVKVPM